MNRRERTRYVIRTYDCRACGAKAGEWCRTMRHHPGKPRPVGVITQPHENRYDQYGKDLAKCAGSASTPPA